MAKIRCAVFRGGAADVVVGRRGLFYVAFRVIRRRCNRDGCAGGLVDRSQRRTTEAGAGLVDQFVQMILEVVETTEEMLVDFGIAIHFDQHAFEFVRDVANVH